MFFREEKLLGCPSAKQELRYSYWTWNLILNEVILIYCNVNKIYEKTKHNGFVSWYIGWGNDFDASLGCSCLLMNILRIANLLYNLSLEWIQVAAFKNEREKVKSVLPSLFFFLPLFGRKKKTQQKQKHKCLYNLRQLRLSSWHIQETLSFILAIYSWKLTWYLITAQINHFSYKWEILWAQKIHYFNLP